MAGWGLKCYSRHERSVDVSALDFAFGVAYYIIGGGRFIGHGLRGFLHSEVDTLLLPLSYVVEPGARDLVSMSIALECAFQDFLVVHRPFSYHSRLIAECNGTFGHENVSLFL